MQIEKFTLPNGRDEYISTCSHFDETKPVKYLVEYSCGQYDTYVRGPVCAYSDINDAIEFVTEHYVWKGDIARKAIKNLYNIAGDYNSEAEDDPDFPNIEQYPFRKLEQDWKDYCFSEMFPGKSWENVSLEEENDYFEKVDDESAFATYLIKEKNIPEDVAQASIIYNTADEHSEYCTDYHIVKINLL